MSVFASTCSVGDGGGSGIGNGDGGDDGDDGDDDDDGDHDDDPDGGGDGNGVDPPKVNHTFAYLEGLYAIINEKQVGLSCLSALCIALAIVRLLTGGQR